MRGLLLAAFSFALALRGSDAAAQTPHQVFLIGDSTVSSYGPERAPRQGWGMQLQPWLKPSQWQVRNYAQPGRSARSFIEEGRLAPVAAQLRAGDVLLIQFGHNDEKAEDPSRYDAPQTAYPQWLMRYVTLARNAGATPVLVTPLARRIFEPGRKHEQLLDTHGLYTQAMRTLAAREHVLLIDLNAASMAWLRGLGDAASKPYYLHVPAQSLADDTHLQENGAVVVACMVVREWLQVQPSLAQQLVHPPQCDAPPPASTGH